jgi:hypothetical protein
MEVSTNITAPVFAAYLECPTEAYLLGRGEKPTDSFFSDMRRNLSVAFKANVRNVLSADFLELACGRNVSMTTIFVDSATVFYSGDELAPARSSLRTEIVGPSSDYIPVLYSAWDKLEQSDNLLVSFGALAIAQVTGTGIPPIGRILWGDAKHVKTIKIADYLPKAWDVIRAIASESNDKEPPSLVLNKHCPVCDFEM